MLDEESLFAAYHRAGQEKYLMLLVEMYATDPHITDRFLVRVRLRICLNQRTR